MAVEGFTVVLVNLALIGVLPFGFFRRDGHFNARWWLTGSPFFISGMTLIAGQLGWLTAQRQLPLLGPVAMLLALTSVGVICWTVGSHRVPLSLWHQRNDAPVSIVTWGPYRHVRHPFYSSFILAQTAAALLFPHPVTIGSLLYAITALSLTARGEEARLATSTFGEEYRSYMKKTGRLVPGLGRVAA